MKKTILIIFLVILSLRIFAVPASVNNATDVADFFLELNCDSLTIDDVVEFKNSKEITIAYIANLSPSGFIALSVDTDIRPIVAYSFYHDFIYDSNQNNLLYHTLTQDMENRIQALLAGELPNIEENNSLWSNYLNQNWGYFNQRDPVSWPPEGSTSTGGWLETAWNQSPSPYNDFCPIDPETSNRSVVGCVATALAQVLNYNQYIGNRDWNWEDDHYLSSGTSPYIYIDDDYEEYDFPSFSELNNYLDILRTHYTSGVPITDQDISTLSFVSGVATITSYSSEGSGSANSRVLSALLDKFEYDNAEIFTYITATQYFTHLIIDMKNAQPSVITIRSTDGYHSVVCDGYKIDDEDEDYYHLNFGWGSSNPGGGSTPTEAWYDLPEIYGSWQPYGTAVGHICKPGFNGTVTGNIQLNGGSGNVTEVIVTVGYKTTNPDVNGDYEVEIYNGNYEVKAYLWGYEEAVLEDITVIANEITDNTNLELEVDNPSYIYVPTHYPTIQEGIDATEEGDIVIVLEGEYFENINFNGKRIKVASFYYVSNNETYIDNTIINGNNDGRVVTFNSGEDFNSSLEGFTITGGFVSPEPTPGLSHGAGILCSYSSPTLKNLIITGNEANSGAGLNFQHSNAFIKDVSVFDNFNSTANSGYGAITCSWYSNISLENVTVYDNNQVGVSIRMLANVIFNNLTICNNGTEGIYLHSGELTMNNCLVWGNNNGGEQIYYGTNSTLSIDYSDIQGGWEGTGNIDELPLVDVNYKPLWTETEYSPLIDTGDPSIFDPDGTRSDMGAVRAINHKNETIELIDTTEGINWLCFPVINTLSLDADLAENWLSDIWDNTILDEVEWVDNGLTQYIRYVANQWQNSNHEFTSVQGYKMFMHQPFDLDVTGFLEPALTTIALSAGTLPGGQINWVGYFPEFSMKPLDAFEAVLDDIDMIQTKTFTMNKTALGWISAIDWTINPGDLVVVNCTNNCSFYWGEQGGGSFPKNTRSSSESFIYTEEADYIPVYVELDPEALGDPTEIGIFVEGECKGAEVIEDSLVQICAYVLNDSMVFDPGMVEFQLYYGSRSENLLIDTYSIKENLNDAGNIEKLDFSKTQNSYYLISLKDSDNNVPAIIKTSLKQNYPNPFNPVTTINYSLANEGNIVLIVYNIKGQKVKTLVKEIKDSGHYQAVWDGTDNNKKQVASGVYFYRLSTGEKTINKKMLLLK